MENDALRDLILAQGPTTQQSDAIFTSELEFLLRASPGSGKTWTSCRRFIWRGSNWPHSAGGLALLSFTNTAINEFQQATIKIGRRDLLSEPNYVGTFDSFVERFIMSPFGHLIVGNTKRPRLFVGERPGDRRNKSLHAWANINGRKLPVPAWDIVPTPEDRKLVFVAQSYGGVKLEAAQSALNEFLKLGYYSHSQRIFWAYQLLSHRPHIAKVLSRRFPEIIVDEAQDTNVWLLVLLDKIRQMGTKITLVGDPDQCIYEFNFANVAFLSELKEQWKIPEMPLSQSHRCNDPIASAIRNVVGNESFCGCGDPINTDCIPYIIKDTGNRFEHSITSFNSLVERCGLKQEECAILCRGRQQLDSIYGTSTYSNLTGIAQDLGDAAFARDHRKNYKDANNTVAKAFKSLIDEQEYWDKVDNDPDSIEARSFRLATWKFVRSKASLPSLDLNASDWIDLVRKNLSIAIRELGISVPSNLNKRITARGTDGQLPLFRGTRQYSAFRHETIHGVKGESIDGVLLIGAPRFWNEVIESSRNKSRTEDARLAYVGMSRARHLLVVALPEAHFDRHRETWLGWGFSTFDGA